MNKSLKQLALETVLFECNRDRVSERIFYDENEAVMSWIVILDYSSRQSIWLTVCAMRFYMSAMRYELYDQRVPDEILFKIEGILKRRPLPSETPNLPFIENVRDRLYNFLGDISCSNCSGYVSLTGSFAEISPIGDDGIFNFDHTFPFPFHRRCYRRLHNYPIPSDIHDHMPQCIKRLVSVKCVLDTELLEEIISIFHSVLSIVTTRDRVSNPTWLEMANSIEEYKHITALCDPTLDKKALEKAVLSRHTVKGVSSKSFFWKYHSKTIRYSLMVDPRHLLELYVMFSDINRIDLENEQRATRAPRRKRLGLWKQPDKKRARND
jgi:hypothetical protein